ncbi:MAG: metallophosphoesterase [Spirochaetales bacterium]|nr:metallophosphoesterase [Spirochaetales bacterium]
MQITTFLKNKGFLILSIMIMILAAPAFSKDYIIQDIALTPGKNISEININWYASSDTPSLVQLAPRSAMKNQDFPESISLSFETTRFTAAPGFFSHRTIIRSLASSSEYVYRMGDGLGNWTEIYQINTESPEEFSFLAIGDPQIGTGGTASDKASWLNTLDKAFGHSPAVNFILSVGDQVHTNNDESQFAALLSHPQLKNVPFAPALGNHDDGAYNTAWHFYMPNMSTEYGLTDPGMGDYYFNYGETLFMVLNSNNKDVSSHEIFINNAVAQSPDSTWKIVVLHHDIYGAGSSQATDSSIRGTLRNGLYPVFDTHKIDLVLTGHEHSYARSHVLKGNIPQTNTPTDANGAYLSPEGTIYLTLNSSTGSKYYPLASATYDYVLLSSGLEVPFFSKVIIKNKRLSFSTYRIDTMELFDSFSIIKEISQVQWTLGDVNHDKKINIIDALLVARYYVGLSSEDLYPDLADVDCDGKVNIVDALNIARFYVGLIDAFCENSDEL